MQKGVKKVISLILCFVLLFGNVAVGGEGFTGLFASFIDAINVKASAAESGTCGENLTWTLSDDGTLTISGTGEMENYLNEYKQPWHSDIALIKNIIINPGVTSIGNCAFCTCSKFNAISIPEGVKKIGSYSFSSCSSLVEITIPSSVESLGNHAFAGCMSLSGVCVSKDNTI